MFLGSTGYAHAVKITDSEARYFIKSNANIWKNSLGVRHSFNNGFTADLTDWQLRLVKIFKLEIEPVNKFYVLPAEEISSQISSTTSARRPENRIIPSLQVPWGVKAVYNAEIASSSGGEDIMVAVLDTGILKTHPDLERRISGCKDFTAPKVSVASGKCDDKNGHGTHVSGIIAADGGVDKKGIWGVAPAAELLAFKVCGNNGSCWADDIAIAMRTAVDDGAKVINISLGGDSESQLIKDAINYASDKGVLIVAAAGNDGPYVGSIDYPAANPKVIAVGAIDLNMEVPDWSSRGVNEYTQEAVIEEKDLEFGAPGANIESTWGDGGYAIISGTSMAAPHIAGLAAKLWNAEEENPAQTVRDTLKEIIFDILPEREDNSSGYGFPQLEPTQLIQ